MSRGARYVLAALLLGAFAFHAQAFSFTTSTPIQCQNLTLTWSGNPKGDLHLLLVPTFEISAGRILNITIPASSSNTHSFQLNEPGGLAFIATMWDDDGLGSGGSTEELTVGSSNDSSCLDANVLADFFFSTQPAADPASCSSMRVEWNSNATRPLSLVGLIPRGTVFGLPVPQDPSINSFDWTVDIAEGTRVLLTMGDEGPYRTGGSTPLWTIGSGSTSCITDSSPKTAANNNSSEHVDGVGGTSAGGTSDQSGDKTGGSGSSKSTPVGAIVGGTVGGVAFLVLLAILLFYFFRRKAAASAKDSNVVKAYGLAESGEKKRRSPMDLLGGAATREGKAQPANRISNEQRGEERRLPVPSEAELDGSYYPSPFQYPSPPDSPGASAQPMRNYRAASIGLPSDDLKARARDSQAASHSNQGSEADTSRATLGHSRSTHKPRVHVTNPDTEVDPSSFSTSTPTAIDVAQPTPARPFVQHTDAEEVEELPPSYHNFKTSGLPQ